MGDSITTPNLTDRLNQLANKIRQPGSQPAPETKPAETKPGDYKSALADLRQKLPNQPSPTFRSSIQQDFGIDVGHPIKALEDLTQRWHEGVEQTAQEVFPTTAQRNERYRSFLENRANSATTAAEKENWKAQLDYFTKRVNGPNAPQDERSYTDTEAPFLQATVTTLGDWYNPMMMALRGMGALGKEAGAVQGVGGMILRRAFYAADAAVGGKFSWDQFQSSIENFKNGNIREGFSDLGGGLGTAFLTALGIAMARPSMHPNEVRDELKKRMDSLQQTLKDHPEFQKVQDLHQSGKIKPVYLPNLTPEMVNAVRQHLDSVGRVREQYEFGMQPEREPRSENVIVNQSDIPIINAPVMDAQEREFARQDAREKEVRDLIQRERDEYQQRLQAKMDEVNRLGKQEKQEELDAVARQRDEEIKRVEEEQAKAPKDRRRFAPAFDSARENLSRYQRLTEEMQRFSEDYVGRMDKGKIVDVTDVKANPITRAQEIIQGLRGEPGARLSDAEENFLQMDKERKKALRESDWRSVEPLRMAPAPDEKPRKSYAEMTEDELVKGFNSENRKRYEAGEPVVTEGDEAAKEFQDRMMQLLGSIDLIERESGLRDAEESLNQKAKNATSPDEADELSQDALQAREIADAVRKEREQAQAAAEARRTGKTTFPIAGPADFVMGRAGTIGLSDGRTLPIHYAWASLKDVLTSHDPTKNFEENPEFYERMPRGNQKRDYATNTRLQAEIMASATKFDPNQVFNTAGTPIEGPPTVRRDGAAIGGRGRLMRLKVAYSGGWDDRIKQDLREKAAAFGLDPNQMPAEQPIVIRVLDNDVEDAADLTVLGQEFDRDPSMGVSAAEEAVAASQRLTPDLVDWASRAREAIGDDASTRDFLRFRGKEVLEKMVSSGMIPANKLAEYTDAEGDINEKGKDLWESAVRGSYLKDTRLINDTAKELLNKVDRADVYWLKLQTNPLWDIGDYMREALRLWNRYDKLTDGEKAIVRQRGKADESEIAKWLHPEEFGEPRIPGMEMDPVHPAAEAIARLLERSGLEVKRTISAYTLDSEGTQAVLGGMELNPRDSFNQAIAEKVGLEVSPGEWGQIKPLPKEAKQAEQNRDELIAKADKFSDDNLTRAGTVGDQRGTVIAQTPRDLTKISFKLDDGTVIEVNPDDVRFESKKKKFTPEPIAAEPTSYFPPSIEGEKQEVATAVAEPPAPFVEPRTPMDEGKLRAIFAQHSGLSAGKINAAVEVWKRFAERYAGMPFDEWLRQNVAAVRVMPESEYQPTRGALEQAIPGDIAEKIKQGGGVPNAMENVEQWKKLGLSLEGLNLDDPLVYFEDPDTHTTLALPMSQVNPAAVKSHIAESRGRYQGKSRSAAAGPRNLFQSYGMGMTPDELESFVKKSGRNIRIEDYGEQGALFGGPEKQYRIWNRVTRESTLVTQSQLDQIKRLNPFLEATADQQSMFAPMQGTLFQESADKKRIIDISIKHAAEAFEQRLARYRQIVKEAKKHKQSLDLPVSRFEVSEIQPAMKAYVADKADFRQMQLLNELGVDKAHLDQLRMFSQDSLFQGKKGATDFLNDGRAVVSLFEQSDISTLLHEGFHVFRRNLRPEDLAVLEKEFKVKDGIWNTVAEEKAARAYERYWHDGEAPNAELKGLFSKIRAWMLDVYRKIKGSAIDVKVSPEVRKVFDKMLQGEAGAKPVEQRSDEEMVEALPSPEPESAKESERALGLTPDLMEGAQLVAEGGEPVDLDSRQKAFENQALAIEWATANKDNLKGIKIFALKDGGAVAQFVPSSENVLFQDTEDERKIRAIKQRMAMIIPDPERSRLGKLLQQLESQKGQKAVESQLESRNAPEVPPEPEKKVVKLWTPEGEREVSNEPRTEQRRTAANETPESRQPGEARGVPVEARQPRPRPEDGPTERGVRTGREPAEGRGADRGPRKALRDVPSTRVAAPLRERGKPIYSADDWANKTKAYRIPQNSPVPDVSLPADIRRMLIFPGQPEVAEILLSGLKQHDGVIAATSTGTGKTYLASAIMSQMVKPDSKVLYLTLNKDLINDPNNGVIAVARDFDVNVQELPPGVGDPSEPGVYATTYMTAIGRDGIQNGKWDFVVADEIGAARRWYESQTGAMMKQLASGAKKVLWMSATPFHTALEIGHMEKLGLWRDEGFDTWGKQFGIYKDDQGNWAGGNAPRKLVKLRQQLIERGQYVNMDRIMDGYKANFAVVPQDEETRMGVRNIVRAFNMAEDYFVRKGKKSMIRAVRGNAVTFMKNYLERQRLPQAIELAKKLEGEGWKVIIMSENKKEVPEIFDFLKQPDEALGGQISALLPKLPGVVEELQKQFGDELANFSGKHSAARSEEKQAFKTGAKKHIFATYGAGGVGISLHDDSKGGTAPRAAIYLGPPWSGIMLDQAIGRPWRFGTNSNVHAIFLVSNARPEMRLVLEKIAPRFESLKAMVSGIESGDPLVESLRNLETSKEAAAAYDLGQEQQNKVDDFLVTEDTKAIVNWKNTPIESAENAKGKGMKFPGGLEAAPHPGIIRLFQDEPEDFLLPNELEAQNDNEEIEDSVVNGGGAPGMGPKELQEIAASTRAGAAPGIALDARAASKGEGEMSLSAVRDAWNNQLQRLDSLKDAVGDTRGAKAVKVLDLYWLTSGRRAIQLAAERAGNPAMGAKLARMIPDYHVVWENTAGPWVTAYYDILGKYKISKEAHHNLVETIEGKKPPITESVAKAAEEVRGLFNKVRERLAKEEVYVTTPAGERVLFSDVVEDPKYWPRKYDRDMKIELRDPWDGKQFEISLRELLDLDDNLDHMPVSQRQVVEQQRVEQNISPELKQLFDQDPALKKRERIIRAVMKKTGQSRQQIEDWLYKYKRATPMVGNIERTRENDIPFYRTDPGAAVAYLEGAAEVVARKKLFGQDRSKLQGLVEQVDSDKSRAIINEIFDSLLSRRPFEEETSDLVSLAADWSVLSKMTFSALKVLGHPIHTTLFTGFKPFARAMFEGATNWKAINRQAMLYGSILEQSRTEVLREYGLRRRAAAKMLDMLGYQGGYKFGRVLTTEAAKQYLNKQGLRDLIKDPQGDVRRQIKDIYLLDDAQIDRAIASKRWQEEDLARAGAALSNEVMFTFDPTELPINWRNRSTNPGADNALALVRTTTLLKSYMFKTAALLKDRLWTEAQKGNFKPWLPFLLLYPAMGEMIADASALFTLNPARFKIFMDKKEQTIGQFLWRYAGDIAHMTGLTFAEMMLQNVWQGDGRHLLEDTAQFLAGPVWTDLFNSVVKLPADMMGAKDSRYSSAAEKRFNATMRWLESTLPGTRPLIEATGAQPKPEKEKTPQEKAAEKDRWKAYLEQHPEKRPKPRKSQGTADYHWSPTPK